MSEKNCNYCVILAGGAGRRLWPYSSKEKPKQFLDFFGVGRTLLQQTYDRFVKIVPPEHIFVSTFSAYEELVREQLPDVPSERILSEPVQLGTAPAVSWANWHIRQMCPEANIVVTPSDQQILQEDCFVEDLAQGFDFVARTPNILALAVKPTRPETEYGYIQVGENHVEERYAPVQSFTEKPDIDFARMFMESGEFYWNTGLLMWNVQTMRAALKKTFPEVANRFDNLAPDSGEKELHFVREHYPSAMYCSIDLLVLEKMRNVYTLCGRFGWLDLGNWGKLYDTAEKDGQGNATFDSQVVMLDCKDNLVRLPADKVAILQGLEGYILSMKGNTLVICRKDDPAQIRKLMNEAQMRLGEKAM